MTTQVNIHPHARDRAAERGVTEAEIGEMGLQNGQGCLDQVAFGLSITIRTKGEYI